MFRKNTAGQFIHVQGVDSTNGAIKSGVTWTVRRCIDGTFAAATGTATEDGTTGWYKFAMSQADTNGNNVGFNFTGTGAIPQTVNIVTTACDPTSTAFGLVIAKTTNITGFNDIAATAVVSAGAITTSSGAVSTVTTVTNQLTAAAIATGIWQDAVAGDFTVASSIGKTLYIANVAPGGSGGLMISGTNAGTTTLGALTITGATTHSGNVVLSDGLTISAPSTLNRAGLDVTGNGTGAAIKLAAGATGVGIGITTTAGDGLSITPTAGHAITATGQGTTKHGINATGGATSSDGIRATGGGVGHGVNAISGSGATGDGIRAAANSTNGNGLTAAKTGSGNDLNATITPLTLAKTTNITGFNDIAATAVVSAGAITTLAGAVVNVDLVDTLTTYTGNTLQTGDSFARLGAPAGVSVSADIAAIEAQTDDIGVAGAGLTALGDTRIANLDATVSSRATPVQVNTEVVDALNVDTYTESAAVPAATSTLVDKIRWMFTLARNKITQTATTQTLRNDADGADISTSTHSDDGVTHIRGEWV